MHCTKMVTEKIYWGGGEIYLREKDMNLCLWSLQKNNFKEI